MKKGMIIAIVAVAIAIPAAAYTALPLFVSTTINEPPPATSGPAQEPGTSPPPQEPETPDSEVMTKPSGETEAMINDSATVSDSTGNENDVMTKEISGTFAGAGDGFHNAQGTARVIYIEDGSAVLRFEDFTVTNGPDLYVYLSTDKGTSDFVSLGRLKASSGNQNYQLPDGIDLSKYDNVIVWCQAFSVYFGGAELRSV